MNERRPRTRKGLPLGPAFLILAGVLLLLGNFGVVGDGFFGILAVVWPYLALLIGLDALYRRQVFGAVFWLGLGGTFLAAGFGWLPGSPGFSLMRMWPLLVVSLGLEVIFGRKSLWMAAAGAAIGLLFLAGGLWYLAVQDGELQSGAQTVEQPLGDYDAARIFLAPPVASLTIDALVDSGNLVEGSYATFTNVPIETGFEIDGGTGVFSLEPEKKDVNIGFWDGSTMAWTFGLNPAVVHDLAVEMGVGDLDVDLAGLEMSALDISAGVAASRIVLAEGDYRVRVESGVGRIVITLPETGQLDLRVNLGVGEVVIVVPAGMDVRVRADRGLAGFQSPGGFLGRDNVYASPGYAASENRTDITISVGVGNIVVR